MTPEDWQTGFAKSLAVLLNGDALPDPDSHGRPVSDDTVLLLFNAHDQDVTFLLPDGRWGQQWQADFETAVVPAPPEEQCAEGKIAVAARDVRILRRV